MINNRINDTVVEGEIAKFLDKNLYSNKELFSEFARTNGLREQFSGSDIIVSTSDGLLNRVVVDEKVSSRYANTKLDTFALELSFIGKNGMKRIGWFMDSSKITDYYLLGWIIKADIPYDIENSRYDTDKITCENIKEMDYCLVKRDKIIKFLDKRGWTVEKLASQDNMIRERGYVKTNSFLNDVSFRYSKTYVEQPINILLKKETYFKLSHINGKIKID